MITISQDLYSEYLKIKSSNTRQKKIVDALKDEIYKLKKSHQTEVNELKKEIRKLKGEFIHSFDEMDIFERVAQFVGIDSSEITGKCRKRKIMIARQLIQHYFYTNQMMTLKQVGRIFKAHHSTIIHNLKQANNFLDNPNLYPYENKIYKEAILLE